MTRRRFALVLTLWVCTPLIAAPQDRPKIGVALGGGAARGIAHVGVLRWFERHRIPIDFVAGTSMGGLVGGAFAIGMSADEIEVFLGGLDWDTMFGATSYAYRSVQRKQDARAYPARLEFGIRHGIVAPPSLNNGQRVDLMLASLTAAYYALEDFDDLPTPFRCVSVDIANARRVVFERGHLATAMRATMSLAGVFPPVQIGRQVLVDGGYMDNVPADVARSMGADIVIAVDVGGPGGPASVDETLLGVVSRTTFALGEATTREALAQADIVIRPDLAGFGALDWRRQRHLIGLGYAAAEARRELLLPYVVDEATWSRWLAHRRSKRRTTLPEPEYVAMAGVAPADASVIRRALARFVDQPLNVDELERDLSALGGLDRYESVTWRLLETGPDTGLLVRARPKPYAPPFLMLGLNLSNTTSDDFDAQLAARLLAFDVLAPGAELRVDGRIGSNPGADAEWRKPLGRVWFVAPYLGVSRTDFEVFVEGRQLADYRQDVVFSGIDIGIAPRRTDEIRGGLLVGRRDFSLETGDPDLPNVDGPDVRLTASWIHDSQDDPVVPSRGMRLVTNVEHFLRAATLPLSFPGGNEGVTQAAIGGSGVRSLSRRNRLFVAGSAGTSFDGSPFIDQQFTVGDPLRLGAFTPGELRGDNVITLTGGYLHQVARLPDFVGGPVFAGGWLETGSVFDEWSDASVDVQLGFGLILDSLIGPAIVGGTFGFGGPWRTYIGIGRVLP